MAAPVKINIMGSSTRLDVAVACAIAGAAVAMLASYLASSHTVSQHSHTREGWVGAPLKYNMQQGVPSSGPAMVGPP